MNIMATGLGYFPIGVDFFENDTVVIMETKYGIKAPLLIIKLLCKIYGENYFYRWGEDERILFTHKLGADYTVEFVKEVVEALVSRGFFDKERFEKFGILTSVDIQSLYFEAVQRRKQVEVEKEYLLMDVEKYKNVHIKGEPQRAEVESPKAATGENVDIKGENENILTENADILEQKKRKEMEMKRNPSSKSSPKGTPGGKKEEDILSLVPKDGVERNVQGLWETLTDMHLPEDERSRLMRISNWGEIGHPVWKAVYEIRCSGGRINQPGKYIMSRLMKRRV